MNNEIFEKFMKRRFPRERDPSYIDDWRRRFMSGNQEAFMDSESLRVYREILREHKSKVLNTVDTGIF